MGLLGDGHIALGRDLGDRIADIRPSSPVMLRCHEACEISTADIVAAFNEVTSHKDRYLLACRAHNAVNHDTNEQYQ